MTTIEERLDADFAEFIRRNESRIGTGVEAIEFALTIDDHLDLRQFLEDWQTGMVANLEEYEDYREWLRERRDG